MSTTMLNPNEPASDRPNSSEIPMDEFEHCRIVGVVRRKLALEKLYDIPSQLTYLDHHGRSMFHDEDIQHWKWDHRDEIAASAWDEYYPGFGPQKPAGDRRGSEC
nr:hypothetical protein B0A51_17819 [Rachicladosporium sp. CCFEE 5018]